MKLEISFSVFIPNTRPLVHFICLRKKWYLPMSQTSITNPDRNKHTTLGVNARGCRPTPSSRWRWAPSSPRLITGKFTDTAHLLETHSSWGYCRWYEEHWGGVSSRDRHSFSRDSNLKSCMVTRVMHLSVFPVSRVTVFHVEGDATVDEGDACLIGLTVIDISRFHFCYSCLFLSLVQYY